jgi:membrane carboxypeptidase/penicillin-binding protein PbpC
VVINSDPSTVTLSRAADDEITFSIDDNNGIDAYNWYVNGVLVTSAANDDFVFKAREFAVGQHTVFLAVEINGVIWSSPPVRVTVNN